MIKNKRQKVIGSKYCDCGCFNLIPLRNWHYEKTQKIPRFIVGHNKEVFFKKGNLHSFKTGECKQGEYILVYSPNHPNANANNQVKRSRLVMEKHLSRYLNKNEIVHHINEIKDDDRIENLQLMTNSEHLSYHHKGKSKKRNQSGRFKCL